MDRHVGDYYREFSDGGSNGLFHRVIAVHECPDCNWETVTSHVPSFPRGWFELSQLGREDRVEFISAYWLAKLPYQPHTHEALERFFRRVDDIGVYITQDLYDSPPEVQMVYSLKGDSGFFRGACPASEEELEKCQPLFRDHIMPADYVAFLRIHNGFGKYTDTGISSTKQISKRYQQLQQFLMEQEPLVTRKGDGVDVSSLIPFYESFGMHCYQCFWGEWYPQDEMGNVYYSGIEKTLADFSGPGSWEEKMAFPTFLDWLLFYLEGVEVE